MTLEEIETLLDEKLVAKTYGEIAFVDNVPEISKLILASHLRSQIELLDFILISRDSEVMLKVKKQKLELELTKLNQ